MPGRKPTIDRNNPAFNFLSVTDEAPALDPKTREPEEESTRQKPPAGYKINPLYVETKSRRVQILLKPSNYQKAKDLADKAGQSFNDFINTLLEEI